MICRGGAFDRLHICERGKAFLRGAQQNDGVDSPVDFLKAAANFAGRARVSANKSMMRRRR